MNKNSTFNRRVWGGDASTIDEARARCERNPDGQLLHYASVLYSFRNRSSAAEELTRLHHELTERARSLIAVAGISGNWQDIANEMDMLATYLTWLSYRKTFTFPERLAIRKLAWDVADKGYLASAKVSQPYQKHTPLLLLLTQAELLMDEKLYAQAKGLLSGIASSFSQVSDPNQMARIYRKTGMLYRRLGWNYGMPTRMCYGFWLILRAAFLKGIPLNNRLKSVAAFFGISR